MDRDGNGARSHSSAAPAVSYSPGSGSRARKGGPLWPYLLGLSLVPALLACVLSLLGLANEDAIGRPRAALLLVVGAAGLGLVHPHAVSALALVSYVVLVTALLGRLATRRTGRSALLAAAGVLLPLVAWWVAFRTPKMQGMARAYARGPEESVGRAVAEGLLNGPRYGALLWVTSALVVVGLVVCARRASLRWVPAAYVVLVLVLIGVAAEQSGFTRALTVFWYNDPPRLGALVPLAGVPALVAGLDVGVKALRLWGFRRATAAVLVVYLLATLGNNQGAHVGRLGPFYQPHDPAHALLTTADGVRLAAARPAAPRRRRGRGQPVARARAAVRVHLPAGALLQREGRDDAGPRAAAPTTSIWPRPVRTCATPYAARPSRTS